TVNFLPAVQFNIPHAVILSTNYTETKGLTQRLKEILQKRDIKVTIFSLDINEEKNPLLLLDKLLPFAKNYERIIWNISGGQKIPTIALQTAFQRRIKAGFKDDILLYLEANPPETWYYDSAFNPQKVQTKANINLKEILYLYGFDLYEDETEKTIQIYPKPSGDTIKKLDIGRKALKYYMADDHFREVFFNWMKPYEPEISCKSDIEELIRNSLNQLKPLVNEIRIKKAGYENLEKRIDDVIKSLNYLDMNKLKTNINKLKLITKPEQIFNDYWDSIKREVIHRTIEKIPFAPVKLLQRDVNSQITEKVVKQIQDIGGIVKDHKGDTLHKADVEHFSALKKGNGFLFEWMVASLVYDTITNDPLLKESVSQIHLGVKTKPINSPKHDSELDLVITTKFGTLITFELKTYSFSGETAKAKEGTTYKKSGPYGRAIIIGPLLKAMVMQNVDNTKNYPYYIDGVIRSQQETAERNGIEYWYLDDIETKLVKVLS
ncbi:MAG: hypothetical protein N2511_08250, partial [Thermodesulfovibrionales bacterium]|nr:hypothetical protein [Thermodesulfovibrionales bacterium]